MGPRPRGRGNQLGKFVVFSVHWLQWGRGHVAAEIGSKAVRWIVSSTLQWGRGHVAAEIWPRTTTTIRHGGRFNGAAATWPRKSRLRNRAPQSVHRFNGAAATWPRKYGGGKMQGAGCVQLQWGRGHVAAEMMYEQLSGDLSRVLQWGRGHVAAEIIQAGGESMQRNLLQWGRGHVAAEITGGLPSMMLALVLQWGRGHVAAEMFATRCAALSRACFNGAAATWPRKSIPPVVLVVVS